MGVSKDETIHVGMGQATDLEVCQELDIDPSRSIGKVTLSIPFGSPMPC